MKGEKYIKIREELKDYKDNGIKLYFMGESSTPKKIAKAQMVAENSSYTYMADYISDDQGKIVIIDFHYVENK